MWSNAFCQTLELTFPDPAGVLIRPFGRRVVRILAHASGAWSLGLSDGRIIDVRLRAGWIAAGGHAVGLSWVAGDGYRCSRRHACVLVCARPRDRRWRRLLVRLRVPMATQLS